MTLNDVLGAFGAWVLSDGPATGLAAIVALATVAGLLGWATGRKPKVPAEAPPLPPPPVVVAIRSPADLFEVRTCPGAAHPIWVPKGTPRDATLKCPTCAEEFARKVAINEAYARASYVTEAERLRTTAVARAVPPAPSGGWGAGDDPSIPVPPASPEARRPPPDRADGGALTPDPPRLGWLARRRKARAETLALATMKRDATTKRERSRAYVLTKAEEQELARRFRDWDDLEQARVAADLVSDLKIVWPDATDPELAAFIRDLRVSPSERLAKARRVPPT